jgi:ABC-type dipeptide/oligopeptide/nickel transport system permease component
MFSVKITSVRRSVVKGLPQRRVLVVHALRNVLLPVITVIGLELGTVFGGAIIVESVFGWPGIGNLSIKAVYAHDYPLVQGAVLFVATAFVLINLGTDLLYAVADPRVRYRD